MSLGDAIRNFFNRKRNPELPQLEEFLASHKGVEGYIEPRTATNPTSLLLVDRDGEHVRASVRDEEDAVAFCQKSGIPVYDASVLGYPERMRRGRSEEQTRIDEEIARMEQSLREDRGPGSRT